MGITAIQERPVHAQHIAHVICQWTMVESFYGTILGMMAGSDVETALLMHEAILGTAASDATLRAVAGEKLTAPLQEQLIKTLADTRRRAKERNTIAHGIWAISNDYPDALINVHPREIARHQARNYLRKARGEVPERLEPQLWGPAMIWTVKDFQEVAKRIQEHGTDILGLAEGVAKETGRLA